jgi:hypothetical protein
MVGFPPISPNDFGLGEVGELYPQKPIRITNVQ